MSVTNKGKVTRPYDALRATAIKKVATTKMVTEAYVRSALLGIRKGGQTEEIISEYRRIYTQLEKALN